MSAVDKVKLALAVVEKYGFESIIGIDATRFGHTNAHVHLSDVTELTGFDCQVVDHNEMREVFTMLDGVKVFTMLTVEERVA